MPPFIADNAKVGRIKLWAIDYKNALRIYKFGA